MVEERAFPSYPASQVQRGKEGWVRINFMVGTDGRTYECTLEVVGDSGTSFTLVQH